MICVDTSVWIAAQRGHDPGSRLELHRLLQLDQVMMPVVVRLELLTGAPRARLQRWMEDLDALPAVLPAVPTWRRLEQWVTAAPAAQRRFGIPDLLIAALAAERDAAIWSLDRAFTEMADLGWVSLYPQP